MPIEGRPSPPPLRFTLVLIVSILIIAHLILEKALEVAFEQPPRVEKHQIQSARQLIGMVQQALSSDTAIAESPNAEQIIRMQGADSNVEFLALLNQRGEIVFSTKNTDKMQPANEVITDFDADAYQQAKSEQRMVIDKSPSGKSITLYAPLSPSGIANESKPGQSDVLYLNYDLVRAKRDALRENLALSNWLSQTAILILSAVLIIYLLNHWVAEPLRRIGKTVSRVAKGDIGVATGFQGSSELALLGMGVDSMSREIDASKSALVQANLELEKRVNERTEHLEREIRYRRNLERALRIHERQMQTVFNTVSEGIALWDAEGRLLYANPGFKKLLCMEQFGCSVGFGENSIKLVTEDGDPLSLAEFPITKTLSDLKAREGVIIGIEQPDSGQRWVTINVIPVTEVKGGAVTGIVSSVSDVTDLKYHENQLDQMAHFDALTGLPNRRLLHDRMQQLVENTRRKGRILAVCYLDLDGFKHINDTYGHKAGDGLLVEAASRFVNCVRAGDTVARLGGDEFVILLANIEDETECESILNRVLSSLSNPYTVAGNIESGITVSAGITLYPADNRDPDTLLRHADQAMYAAKRSGKNRYHWFDPNLEQRLLARNDSLNDIARALSQREFVLHYQPKIRCHDGAVVGAEALLRWQHPVLGTLPPAHFIPLVEEHDIALELGRYVIQEALVQARAWLQQGHFLSVGINIFARQLQQPNFAEELEHTLNQIKTGQRFSIDLEIVESAALEGIRDFPALVRRCEAMDVTFSLDDFGTGYSTLDHLRRIPAQSLKIDRSFVNDLLSNSEDRILIEATIGLGRAFGRKVIAEGVETEEQLRWLRAAGCDEMQGFLFARPMDSMAFLNWLQQYRPSTGWFDS
ncbi:MAG: EAL domain-containing protein [Chromatiaceae bacterium]|nr:EAL domain-containing protein [Chromatiaceae bacterium]MCP5441563.1 EAL domain-containing protein [Chromatiaceae bacterium]